ncbi:MAG: hypothetical protein AB7G75_03545 [Candidatus Binatia bacterium]
MSPNILWSLTPEHHLRLQATNKRQGCRGTVLSWFSQVSFVFLATMLLSAAFANAATLQICASSLGCTENETEFTPGDTVYITGSGWDGTTSEDVELQITEAPPHGSHVDVLYAVVHEDGTIDSEYIVPGHGGSGQTFTLTATQLSGGSLITAAPIGFSNGTNPVPFTWNTSTWTTPGPSTNPWVRTDRDDYPPGDTVYIAGGGWQPGELVTLEIEETGPQDFHPTETLHAIADAQGNIYAGYVIQDHDLGQSFVLTASGTTGTAETMFTDAANTKVINAQTVSPVTVTITATLYTAANNCTGASSSVGPFSLTSSTLTQITDQNTNGRSVKLSAPASPTSPSGSTFTNWTSPTGGTFAVIGGDPKVICISGTNGNQTDTFVPNYTAAKSDQTITFNALTNKTYGDADFSVSATASSGLPVAFSSQTTSVCTVSGTTVHIVSAGTCTLRASQAGDSSYNAAPNVDQSFTINKANATVVVTPYNVTYDGNTHTATYTITGVNGETGATVGTVDVSNTTHTNAGTYTSDTWSFTGTANYNDIASTTITNIISKADATCSVSGYTGVYDAVAHGATGSCTGVDAGDLSSSLNLGATFTDVPGGTANWSFSGGTNYNDKSGSVGIVINKADASCTVSGYTGVYDAAAHGATGSCTGVDAGGTAAGGSLNLGNSFTDVPGGTANWSFSGGTNYNDKSGSVNIVIQQRPLTVIITAPSAGSLFTATTAISFKGTVDGLVASQDIGFRWAFDGINVTGTSSGSSIEISKILPAGVYQITLTVNPDGTNLNYTTAETNEVNNLENAYVVVYDPNGGFVTGGGWIMSPTGACKLQGCENTTGKANFGFVSKYKKGANIPTGETEFQFKAGNLNFHSTVYEWLVVSGAKAQYKGSGTINGAGDYGFLLTATDGQINGGGGVDKFRIKIWNASGVVYDNKSDVLSDDIDTADPQAINGGSIAIHK